MRRSLLLIGAGALAVAAIAAYELRGSDPAPDAAATATPSPATAARASGAATATRDPVRTPVWKRKAAAEAREQPALPSLPDPSSGAKPGAAFAARGNRRFASSFRPMFPVTEADLARSAERSIQRYEAKHGPLDKSQRRQLVKQLKGAKPTQPERVPGAKELREKLAAQSCTGPSAQQRYLQLSAGDQVKMRQRCAPYGFTPPP